MGDDGGDGERVEEEDGDGRVLTLGEGGSSGTRSHQAGKIKQDYQPPRRRPIAAAAFRDDNPYHTRSSNQNLISPV